MLKADQMLDTATWQTSLDDLFARISDHYIVDEDAYLTELCTLLGAGEADFARIGDKTAQLVRDVRAMDTAVDSIDELLQQYSLNTQEGGGHR